EGRRQPADLAIEIGVRALGREQLGEERLACLRFFAQRTQHVEALDVAAAFPDRVQRRLSVETRQIALLDIAGAAEAFLRLVDERRAALADPVLADRGGHARERSL